MSLCGGCLLTGLSDCCPLCGSFFFFSLSLSLSLSFSLLYITSSLSHQVYPRGSRDFQVMLGSRYALISGLRRIKKWTRVYEEISKFTSLTSHDKKLDSCCVLKLGGGGAASKVVPPCPPNFANLNTCVQCQAWRCFLYAKLGVAIVPIRVSSSCLLLPKVKVRFAAQGANRSVEVSQAVLNMSTGSNKEPNSLVVVEHERCVYPHVEKCATVCNFV